MSVHCVESKAYESDWDDEIHLTPSKIKEIVDERFLGGGFPTLGVLVPSGIVSTGPAAKRSAT